MGRIGFNRIFAMPSGDTLSIAPIRTWVKAKARGVIVDPFARNCRIAKYTNDLNPDTAADYHMDACDFLEMLVGQGVIADTVIFDPPYSPRQVSELYANIGRDCTTQDTQTAAFYKKVRDALDAIVPPGGVVLSFGWHTNGMGIGRGYQVDDILLINHGGAHNDTICMAETKQMTQQESMF